MTVFTVVFDYPHMSEVELTTVVGELVSNKRLNELAMAAGFDRYLKTYKPPSSRWLPPYYKSKDNTSLQHQPQRLSKKMLAD